ncbi:MAG: hypothetical protein SPK23_03005 [Eubacteriales bacterium]|nr:hypothetical protein [Clostridiales bacterium]MDY5836079.1 hypothetical protein [Eubacteriales bacterium]
MNHKLIRANLARPALRPCRMLALLLTCLICVLGLTGCQPETTEPVESSPSEVQTESPTTSQTEVEPEANKATTSTSLEEPAPSPGPDKAGQVQELKFSDMYEVGNSSRGLRFSDHFKSLDGQQVKMNGFMAPPLKPVFNFFVLSKEPMAICPFCSSDADWPADIVAVYVDKGTKSVSNDSLLTIVGRLELGSFTDKETGFVSQARIYAEEIIHNR